MKKNCILYTLNVQFIMCLVFMCSTYVWTSFFSSEHLYLYLRISIYLATDKSIWLCVTWVVATNGIQWEKSGRIKCSSRCAVRNWPRPVILPKTLGFMRSTVQRALQCSCVIVPQKTPWDVHTEPAGLQREWFVSRNWLRTTRNSNLQDKLSPGEPQRSWGCNPESEGSREQNSLLCQGVTFSLNSINWLYKSHPMYKQQSTLLWVRWVQHILPTS